jgi:hypothetical protein
MGVPTHVMEFSSGMASEKDGGSGLLHFQSPLRQLDGADRWFLSLSPLPEGKRYSEVRNVAATEYIQAGGSAEKLMLDIRKPGGHEWGVQWVRYIIGHLHEGDAPIDVAIELPHGPEMVSASEVFGADEAGEIFYAYYKTGDIPPGYALRPVEGYTLDHATVDLRSVVK